MLGNLGKKLTDLAGGQLDNLNLEKVITDQFIKENTTLDSVKSFLDKSGFNVSSLLDLKNVSTGKLDTYIKSISSFSTWKDFLIKAAGGAFK